MSPASQEAMRAEWEKLNQQTEGVVAGEEVQEVVEEKVAPQHEPIPSVTEEAQEETAAQPVVDERPRESENWRRLREKNKELERKLTEMENYIKAPKSEEVQEKIEDFELADDDIAEGRHYKALKKQVKSLNEAIIKERLERDKITVESRLRSNYPDLFKVVTKENMEALAEQEPEFVESIITSPNTYAQHVAAYKLIKKYGIGSEDPYQADKARAQRNLAKPKSAATVAPRQGESPLSEAERFANGLTPDLQAQLIKEMEEAISNR